MQGYIKCASCGTRIRADRKECLRCGEPLRAAATAGDLTSAPVSRGTVLVVSAVALVLLVGGFIVLRGPRTRLAASASAGAEAPSSDPVADAQAAFARGDYRTAKSLYELLLTRKPSDAGTLDKLGQTLARMGDIDGAFARFALAVKLMPNSWAYHSDLAHAATQLSRWDRAVIEYRAAVTLAPTDYVTRYSLGSALHKAGDDAAAVGELEQAIALQPTEPDAHLALGISLEQVGRPADAVREYHRYLELSPSAPGADALRAHAESLARSSAGTGG